MKYLKPILFLIVVNICLTTSVIAQSEQGYILGMKNFEKAFPSETNPWDDFDNLYMDTHYDGNIIKKGVKVNSDKVDGQEMLFEFDHFTVELVMNSNSALVNKGTNNEYVVDANTKTIQLDNHRSLVSWLEDDNTYVTMYADFLNGQTSAFLYKDDGSVTPLSGSIKIKKYMFEKSTTN
ncbi:MAG TPA: hypothetical protein VF870_08925 [Ignavibacteriaceae bacterium]